MLTGLLPGKLALTGSREEEGGHPLGHTGEVNAIVILTR